MGVNETRSPSCRRHRLAVDPHQVIGRPAAGCSFAKELADGRAGLDVNVVGEAAAVVVDELNAHTRTSTRKME